MMKGFLAVFGAVSMPQSAVPPAPAPVASVAPAVFAVPPEKILPARTIEACESPLSRAAAQFEGARAMGVRAEDAMAEALAAFVLEAAATNGRKARGASRKTLRKLRALVDAHARADVFQ